MQSIKDRLQQYLSEIDISQRKFEMSIGMSNGWVNNLGGSIRDVTLSKIKSTYPELSIPWLLTGEGEMLRDVPMEQPSAENAMRSDEVGMLLDRLQAQAEEIGRLKERLECLQKSVGDVRSDARVG